MSMSACQFACVRVCCVVVCVYECVCVAEKFNDA